MSPVDESLFKDDAPELPEGDFMGFENYTLKLVSATGSRVSFVNAPGAETAQAILQALAEVQGFEGESCVRLEAALDGSTDGEFAFALIYAHCVPQIFWGSPEFVTL